MQQMELLTILTVIFIIFIIYLIYYNRTKNSLLIQGNWCLNPKDKQIFGLQSYILHISNNKSQDIQSNQKQECLEGYLIVSNDKGIIYDDLVDIKVNSIRPLSETLKQTNQDRNSNNIHCFDVQITSYGDPILPLNVQMLVDQQKNQMIIKDNDVILVILYLSEIEQQQQIQ